MTTLLQQIEEMRVQVNELASGEQKLLNALGDALTRADHKLLQDVRNVTTEHEMRRSMILHELQTLALSIGAFPDQREPVAALEETPRNLSSFPASSYTEEQIVGRGDWRQAANNIQDELDFHLNGRVPAH